MAEKILIVDDDLDTLRLVGLMLQRQGYEIVAASNGTQALNMAQSDHPDLILLDVMMPDMDGVEVTRQLRQNEHTRDVPIIMFTAKTQVEDKILGFEAGADDYLTKPTQPRELFAHVKAVLARTSKAKKPAAPAAPVIQAAAPPSNDQGYVIGVLGVRGGLGALNACPEPGGCPVPGVPERRDRSRHCSGHGTISLELGYDRPEGLGQLLQLKPTEISEQAVEHQLTPHASGVRVLLASSKPKDANFIQASSHFEAITRQLIHLGRYIVLDLGSSLTTMVEKRVIALCNEIILVVEPVPQTLTQTKALIADLVEKGVVEDCTSVVLVNRLRSGMHLSWSQVQDQLSRPIGVIFTPAPELAYQASINTTPMIVQQPDSLTTQQFAKLAEKVAVHSRPVVS